MPPVGFVTPMDTPIPSTSTISFSFTNCSAVNGHAAMGTPAATLSSVEPHPQCVTKPPTARCDRMATCGAHPRTARHWLSATPSASVFSHSHSLTSPGSEPAPLMTQRTGHGHDTSATPSCMSCAGGMRPALPKLTYSTDLAFLASSHAMHRFASSCEAARGSSRAGEQHSETGPTANTFLPVAAARRAAESRSSSSKLFTTMPSAASSNSRNSLILYSTGQDGRNCSGSCRLVSLHSKGGRTGTSKSSSGEETASCGLCACRYSQQSRENAQKPWKMKHGAPSSRARTCAHV
ncbi:Os04g0523650 [Oryza sativa Japonica Group]|uniref:Os04g0523650 protein n=2 Tax=Oryza sativa subsp. japonica TaxID=39947 RepID=B9FG79_ORYSJ|nr:hypothetical protein OsJ_15509 [Oryza sativa Japonica Group]KAB8096148.1 hypothetical protein EE612_024494 [Oryza sativa]BAS90144.1 Os04g0523650 [Oryza sativa Japonica Group]